MYRRFLSFRVIPVILPSGYLEIRSWFGNIQDEYINTMMSTRVSSNNIVQSSILESNSLNAITNINDVDVPYNFPKISFNNSNNNLTRIKIITLDNNTDLCGYYPDIVREYTFNEILVYYTKTFGIVSSKYIDLLKSILNHSLVAEIITDFQSDVDLLSSDITINSNITIEDIIDILCISYKKSDTPSVNTMINNIIGTYNPYEQCDGNFDSIVLSDCQSVCIEIANYLMELNSLEYSLNFNTYCVSGGHSSHNDYNKKVLKLFFLKIYLIQYFTNSGFENIFGLVITLLKIILHPPIVIMNNI